MMKLVFADPKSCLTRLPTLQLPLKVSLTFTQVYLELTFG